MGILRTSVPRPNVRRHKREAWDQNVCLMLMSRYPAVCALRMEETAEYQWLEAETDGNAGLVRSRGTIQAFLSNDAFYFLFYNK